jgi:hypothetical protein
MITPKLEELILCGKAFFKTFVAGGDKHTLHIGNDRFIIITDLIYFPMNLNTGGGLIDPTYKNHNTQVAIYGERGYNHYIFRNFLDSRGDSNKFIIPIGPTTINTYFLHEKEVGFSFCNAPYFTNQFMGVANTQNPGYTPPIEWGIDGQPASTDSTSTMDAAFTIPIQNNFTVRASSGSIESQQLLYPFSRDLSFGEFAGQTGFNFQYEYPILLVNYVEIIGSANNIQI